jgi:outer membrane protein OmpA-like peptidoglycan-associated protein/tetratricopeptide (TPR) repeat protein
MKKLYFTLNLLLLISIGYCQNKHTEKADKFFNSYQYVSAIKEYLLLAESNNADQYVFEQLADSYYTIFDMENASKWYARAVETKAKPESYYRYAQALKSFKKYKLADKQMDIFSKMIPNDSRAIEYKSNPDYISNLVNKSKMFTVSEVNLRNTEKSDFGALLNNDNTFYFVSTRNTSRKTDKWNDQPFLDIYKSIRNDDGTFSEPTPVKELNTPFHDGPVSISSDGNSIYFARDSNSSGQFEKTKSNNAKIGQQGLYKATKIDGKWTQIEALPFNSLNYSVTCPSISRDGKTLFFASNMPGGFGMSDIWKVSIEASGYGKPVNLGAKINTSEKENFPFIDDENVLYFASSGLLGFGGFDIYKINLASAEEAQNIGKPANSEKDDFSFSFNKKNNVGYFSSNRNGTDAIFTALPVCNIKTNIIVTNKKTGELVANAQITLLDSKRKTIATFSSNQEGKASCDIECEMAYSLQVMASNFDTAVFPIQKTKKGEVAVQAQLMPVEITITDTEVILNTIYFDYNKSNITSQGANELDKLVKVMTENPKMVIFVKSHTDSKGSIPYNMTLSEQRAQATVQYIISKGIASDRITGKGYGNSEPKIMCGTNCTEEEDAQNRRSEFVIVKK